MTLPPVPANMKTDIPTIHIKTLVQQHQLVGVAKPKHPMFSVLRFSDFATIENDVRVKLLSDFYQISLKKDCPCKIKYGQTQYDFDEGIMSFFSPRQVSLLEPGDWLPSSGWLLLIHPDFLRCSPLNQKIKSYDFFDYKMNEALLLSQEEEETITGILEQLEKEYSLPIDQFSQDVVLANLDLLLTYCNRYYNRQFIVRKPGHSELLVKVEAILADYITNQSTENGLPTASSVASELNLSVKYLSDCLKQLTGQTTQQLIHEKLLERAKDLLTTTNFSISQIAYELGFENPQSFSKLFKNKTSTTPLKFRESFH